MFFFYFGNAEWEHGFVNGDLLTLVLFITLIVFGAGRVWGFDAYLERTATVRENPWLALSVAGSLCLPLAVLYSPLRTYFGTVPRTAADWGLLAVTLLVGVPIMVLIGWRVKQRT